MLFAFCLVDLNTEGEMLSDTANTVVQKSTYQSHIMRNLAGQNSKRGCGRDNSPSVLIIFFSRGKYHMEERGAHKHVPELRLS